MYSSVPSDKNYYLLFCIVFLGTGMLITWNVFIICQKYFLEKFVTQALQEQYMFYGRFVSQVPNLIFTWLNVFITPRGSLVPRALIAISVQILLIVGTIVMAMLDTSNYTELIYLITMITIAMLNGSNAVFENSLFGFTATLPPAYMAALVIGNNVCGTLVALFSFINQLDINQRTAAIYTFIYGISILMVCFDIFIGLPLNRFYRHHLVIMEQRLEDEEKRKIKTIFAVMKQTWLQLFNLFFTYIVTLSVFPGVYADIKSMEGLFGEYFTLITCFLTHSLAGLVGAVSAFVWQYPPPRVVCPYAVTRAILFLLSLTCNYHPMGKKRTTPVLIKSDYFYWMLGILLSFSHYHIIALALIYAVRSVPRGRVQTAGQLAGAVRIAGVLMGLIVAQIPPTIV